ncbi:MAG TPA: hypothetical protein VHB77_04025, partial [Planctomycetaceae bacterium]|nr:hypothetical protein [Planctomycetaceae bacterium]
FAFHSSQPQPEGLALEVTRAKPSLNANVLAMVAIDDDGVHDTFAFQWDISLAGADTFTFTAPSALNGRLEFPELGGPRIRNVSQNDAGNGRTRWTLTLEQPLQNRYFVVATAVLPLPADAMVRAPSFVFEQEAAQGAYEPLAVQAEYVLLANRSQFQVAPQAREGIESIPADDLQHVMKVRPDLIDQAAEIVRIRNPQAVVAWKLQRMKAEKLLPAVINLSNQITVLAADGSWRAQAMYRIRNRSRQFLALQMPENSRILSLFVRNLPARPVHTTRNGRNLELIPLPKTIEGDLSFDVTLVFSGRLPEGALPKGFRVARRTLDIPSPHVLQQSEDAEFGMPTAQTTWTVYLPESLDFEILTDPGRTNVNYVTEAEQQMEQATAFLNDLSVLCNINASTSNRRAKAQSLNNLKQSGMALHNFTNNPRQYGLNPQDQQRQKELEQRAEKLSKAISDLEVKNAEEGLVIQSDNLGNTIVLDTKSRGNEQQAAQSLWDANNDVTLQQPQNANGKPGLSTPEVTAQNPAGNYRQQLKSKAQSQSGTLNLEVQQQQQQLVQGQKDAGGQLGWHAEFDQAGISLESHSSRHRSFGTYPNGGTATYPQNYSFSAVTGNPQNSAGLAAGGQGNGGMMGGGVGGLGVNQGQPGAKVPPGMMGGMGGMAMGIEPAAPADARDRAANPAFGEQPPAWTAVGGLSLLIDIPKTGQKLTFAKVTGDARLGLGVRPHETLEKGLGLLWTIAWLALLVGAFWLMRRPERRAKVLRALPVGLAILGGLVFLLLPGQSVLGWLAFWVFLIATAVALFTRRQVRTV